MIELFLVFLFFGGLGVVMLFLNVLLGPRKKNPAKDLPFECGSPYLQKEIPRPAVPFALVALIFLVFDVEVAFLFPWALVLKKAGFRAFLGLCGFLCVLIPAFLYAWKKGALDWK